MSKKISYDEQQKNHTLGESLGAQALRELNSVWVIKWEDHSEVPTEDSGKCDYCESPRIDMYCERLVYGVCFKCFDYLNTVNDDGEVVSDGEDA